MKTASMVASVVVLAGVAASAPAIAQAEVPIKSIVYMGQGTDALTGHFTVPDTDTTRSAYGGRLRRYDVHVAKMFELTDYECRNQTEYPITRIYWKYRAGGGDIDMGMFDISCARAASVRQAYGLGKPEATKVYYYRVPATVYAPILNITGGKISTWLDFTYRFRPEFGD